MTGWGWGGCDAYCKHHGICMVAGKHDIHDTGTHKFSDEERALETTTFLDLLAGKPDELGE